MNRRAILLGHIDGHLSTNVDLKKMYGFLTSIRGGAWNYNEIVRSINMPRKSLDELLHDTKNGGYDYVFFYFSGHGGYERGTVLELNPKGESISEHELNNLASRQLNIYDCCRSLPEIETGSVKNAFAMDSLEESSDRLRQYVRKMYDKRVMESWKQHMSLYSCKVGESSYDFGEGGIYTKYLLDATKTLNSNDTYILASSAHSYACLPTEKEARQHNENQHPDYFMAKLSSRYQLPLAVNISAMTI